jgi:hypothetical protein
MAEIIKQDSGSFGLGSKPLLDKPPALRPRPCAFLKQKGGVPMRR